MATNFNGYEGEMIIVKDGANMTANFRSNFPNEKKGYFFGRYKIEELLNQTGAMGIRVYFGQNNDGELSMVLVAAEANWDDNLNTILDTGVPCPDYCSTDNALNSSQ